MLISVKMSYTNEIMSERKMDIEVQAMHIKLTNEKGVLMNAN